MPTSPLLLLDYAGRPPGARPRTFVGRCWRVIVWFITMLILIVFVTVRAALLLAGFVCVFAGLILLTLGGKRSAARKLLEWRERFIDLAHLWLSDITRVIRRRRHRGQANPIPVATLVTPP
jgi:hypothetical protein